MIWGERESRRKTKLHLVDGMEGKKETEGKKRKTNEYGAYLCGKLTEEMVWADSEKTRCFSSIPHTPPSPPSVSLSVYPSLSLSLSLSVSIPLSLSVSCRGVEEAVSCGFLVAWGR